MDLFVCPKINDLDPTADGFDGGGHTVSVCAVAPACHSHMAAEDRGCDEILVPASNAWRRFMGVEESSEAEASS